MDLLLGYFSSSAIRILSLGFASFIVNGGKVRIIINQYLSNKDKKILHRGLNSTEDDFDFNIHNIQKIRSSLEDTGTHFFECLAWLIASRRLVIQAIKPSEGFGISHYKSGIFSDGKNKVKFKGSCNFTYSGLVENLEELDVKPSWIFEDETFTEYEEYFEDILHGKKKDIEVVDAKSIVEVIESFGNKDLDELLEDEKRLIGLNKTKKIHYAINDVMIKAEEKIQLYQTTPRFPFESGPRDYQKKAYDNWVTNKHQGIFAMATGTGKTITSLNCALEEFRKNPEKIYHLLILVPTITLVEQWEKEVRSFNFQEVYKISSKVDWQKEVITLISTAKRIPVSFALISTYASFVKEKFQNLTKDLPDDTIFIADEGHNLASPKVAGKVRDFRLKKRIGLSATPKRIYDPEGTAEMELFFSDKEPYTFSFPMERAIRENVLCQYYYFPHIIKLIDSEMTEYTEISNQLSKLYRFGKDNPEKKSVIERLLLKRKRIIHKAVNKLPETIEILKRQFCEKGNLKYTFIYVPEGESFDILEDGEEPIVGNVRLINQYTREIAKIDERILVNQFISGMKERDEILKQFQNGEIDVIASMKCLDEGVDIPRAEAAIFCSSTGNPRQFIQRRGRILR
ncbi:MAG: DEAD/DEAH box helicase family protein, partial [Firmicutes bacterium]|nr:DEAD/DEAH box helicase family protein [Bacillota bacterium]